jgi:hypothetical protein
VENEAPREMDQKRLALRVMTELERWLQVHSKIFDERYECNSALRNQTVWRSGIGLRGQDLRCLVDLSCSRCESRTETVSENWSYSKLDLFVQRDAHVPSLKHTSQVPQAGIYVTVHGRGACLPPTLVSEREIDLASDPDVEGGVRQVCPIGEVSE